LRYQRDPQGNVRGMTLRVNGVEHELVSDVEYLPFGPAKGWALANGISVSRRFDHRYRPVQIEAVGVFTKNYALDAAANIERIYDSQAGGRESDYAYDALGRLDIARDLHGERDYDLDPLGNRRRLQASNIDLLAARSQSLGEMSYVYGTDNRLKAVAVDGAQVATYRYNTQGQRVEKTTPTDTIVYYYDDSGVLIAEGRDGHIDREYIYLNSEPLALLVNPGTQPDLFFYHNDHLAAPRALTDVAGTIVWAADYDPYGRARVAVDSIDQNLRLPGQYFDVETESHYNYFRDYDPVIGRYIQSDPAGLAAGPNGYAYADGNPLNRVDPFGLDSASIAFGGGFHYGPIGVTGAASVGIDEQGKVCIQLTKCGQLGFGLQAGLGVGVVASDGDFCEGDTQSDGYFAEGAWLAGAGVSGTRSGDDRSVGVVKGLVGAGGSIGMQKCAIRTICLN
jgi:RHS repeat-associated protein